MTRPIIQTALLASRWEARAIELAEEAAHFIRTNGPRPGARRPAGLYGGDYSGGRPYQQIGPVAVIGIHGLLLQSFPWIGWPWATGYDALRVQFAAALADDQVRAIVMDVNSGGGDVAGCFDLVDWIAEEKASAGKPVAAICAEHAYSAAYALASAADTISVPRTGGVGSIGALAIHWDLSKALGGAVATVVRAGAHKADGHSFAPLAEDVAKEWEQELEDIRTLFAQTVSRGRKAAGADVSVEAALATEARCLSAAAAVEMGLADIVARPDLAFAAVVEHLSKEE